MKPYSLNITMSTGAVVNPAGVGGGATGAASTPIGQGTRPLTSDAVFRIEVSLSSRKSSAIVMKTTARLYSLEGAIPAVPGASPGETIFIRHMTNAVVTQNRPILAGV